MIRTVFLVLAGGVFFLLTGCGGGQIGAGTAIQNSAGVPASSFSAGIAHVAGNYGFTQENYLLEGAERIQQLGSKSIFVYLTRNYRTKYPDRSSGMWSSNPASLVQLAQTTPYARLFAMPFRTFLLTANSFSNDSQINGINGDPVRQKAEEDEFYALTKYFYSHYAGTGKTFILKNWEGDWIGLQDYDTGCARRQARHGHLLLLRL